MGKLYLIPVLNITLALIVNPVFAAVDPATKAEINTLLDKLAASNCQFNRNGDRHSASEAKTHLQKKLNYVEGKEQAITTEQFIEQVAARSSLSGKPYLVQCDQEPVVESAKWLTTTLKSIRIK